MASTQVLKSRIHSVKNTKQITKAMQLVSASKMRRTQDATRASKPYSQAACELLSSLSNYTSVEQHPFFIKRTVKKRLIVAIASDKGLAGAYNSNIFKSYIEQLKKDDKADIKNTTIAVGRKMSQFVTRIEDNEVMGVYENLNDRPNQRKFKTILYSVIEMFEKGEIDAVDIIYTKFINSISQQPRVERVLPAGFCNTKSENTSPDIRFEPSAEEVLDVVARRLIGAQVFQALLDARASEHSMRMIAMKNATDNASDLADDLTLAMNKARQGAITQELAEISGGVEALNA